MKWKETVDFKILPTWTKRCKYLDTNEASGSYSDLGRDKKQNNHRQQPTKSSLHIRLERKCASCKSTDHWLSGCSNFEEKPVAERFDIVKKLGLCLNCLSEDHGVQKCKSKYKCKVCNKLHHSLLHRWSTPNNTDTSTQNNSVNVHTHIKNTKTNVILATSLICIRDSIGNFKIGRALLDSGSQVNLITENFANILNLKKKKTAVQLVGVGCSSSQIKYETQTVVRSRFNKVEFDINFLLTVTVSAELDISDWKLPSNIKLADDHFNQAQPIDMLLGAECFFDILCCGKIKLGHNLPILQETTLGWIVSGCYKSIKSLNKELCFITHTDEKDDDLDHKLEYIWAMENVNSERKQWTDEEQACEDDYVANTSTDINGRIIVKLPFKDSPHRLGNSYSLALKRFESLEKRLNRDVNLKEQYTKFIDEYVHLGHMSLIKNPSFEGLYYVIPHQCVIKLNSTTTKLRVVFDASANTSSGSSLNDILRVGPTIQNELYIQLLRFRLFKYVLTGDIVKMYRMILIDPEHRKFQRILWRDEKSKAIQVYELNTVTYGMSASPFLAIRSLNFLADKYERENPIGANVLRNHFYVDDMLTGSNNIRDLQQIKSEITSLLNKGCMELAKIQSNNSSLRNNETELKNMNLDEQLITNALGITWDPVSDTFLFKYQPKKNYAEITKCSILSLSSSTYFRSNGVTITNCCKTKSLIAGFMDYEDTLGYRISKNLLMI